MYTWFHLYTRFKKHKKQLNSKCYHLYTVWICRDHIWLVSDHLSIMGLRQSRFLNMYCPLLSILLKCSMSQSWMVSSILGSTILSSCCRILFLCLLFCPWSLYFCQRNCYDNLDSAIILKMIYSVTLTCFIYSTTIQGILRYSASSKSLCLHVSSVIKIIILLVVDGLFW